MTTTLPATPVKRLPLQRTVPRSIFEDQWQVILWNDDRHTHQEVENDIRQIFGHNLQLTRHIIHEIERDGKGIVETECRMLAEMHKSQLEFIQYTVEIQSIS